MAEAPVVDKVARQAKKIWYSWLATCPREPRLNVGTYKKGACCWLGVVEATNNTKT